MNTGTILSGIGHAGVILWVVLGDFLFSPKELPEIAVTEVSLMSAAEYDAMVAATPTTPTPAEVTPDPAPQVAAPDPVVPELAPEPVPAEPQPEPAPEPQPEPAAEAQPVPAPLALLAEVEQPLPVPPSPLRPKPRPADRVAPLPVDAPERPVDVAPEATPAVTPEPAPEAEVVTPPKPEAAPEAATTQIITEAVETDPTTPQLAPTSSARPKARPKKPVVPTEAAAATAPKPDAPRIDTNDAVAAALAEAQAETAPTSPPTSTGANAPAGPPMTAGEKDALRVSVQACWNVGSLSSDALRVTVTVGVSVAQSGVPDAGSVRMLGFEGGSDAAARQAFEAARRAIIRCGAKGFNLPPEKYDQWRNIEMVFNPERMRIK